MTKLKGFTLIELLVVIAIVAVLAVVVILTLNPAELLRQARDSNRVSDSATIKSAMALYLADVVSPAIGTASDPGILTTLVFVSASSGTNPSIGTVPLGSASTWTVSSGRSLGVNARAIDGTGWIPVNFAGISSKSPIANLPIDPVNNQTFFYAYAATGSATVAPAYKFWIKAVESTKYANGQTGDVVSTDGGNSSSSLEAGTNLAL
jgi:prepilin-type N-terminal cleavage/methylation domain-containing protein